MGLIKDSGWQRGVELGPYALEALPKDVQQLPTARLTAHPPETTVPQNPLAAAAIKYSRLFAECERLESAPPGAGSTDLEVRAREIKGAGYYLDAAGVGICETPGCAWYDQAETNHTHVVVLLVACGRRAEADNPAAPWITAAATDIAHMRALEIGVSLAGHIRALGYTATCHHAQATALCLDTLSIAAGLTQHRGGTLVHPFLGTDFVLMAISTDYAMAIDTPLAASARVNAVKHWFGINGATSGREQRRQGKRPSHLSRYPMEQVWRVPRPTTLILDDEVPRVPKRAEFFMRARMGDLGAKAQREVARFAFKHPLTDGMMKPLRAMVPHQDGAVAPQQAPGFEDAQANTQAIKSLSYHLGADLTGICEIPEYAWYSHGPNGQPIEAKHKYAVVMLIDQGYDTMEGASGDDWISGCQSMRGYIRGAEVAGVMAEFLRDQGFDSRPQTNADSHVLQIPLVLLAGLGELSRIGELVLNPYVGPRFKSVVLTTNLPLIPDQPIDFGLQDFCSNCLKCARECPVNAIPYGDKVMFNGYEIWKPDVERCTRYRVTNPKGSACGRCMKTCPLNKVVSADGAWLHRMGTWLGVNARPLKRWLVPVAVALDDRLGYGNRNKSKRWWQDLEIVDGVACTPTATNERDLDLGADVSGSKSPVGYYHASDMPPPDATDPVPVNHREAIARSSKLETVGSASERHAAGAAKPNHYIPTRTIH